MRAKGRTVAAIAACAALLEGGEGLAQTTGLVVGPKVDPADRSFEYRIASAPREDRLNQRIHYQHSVSDRLRLRAGAVFNDGGNGEQRFRSLLLESHYQFRKRAKGWNSGLQFQGVVPDGGDGPGRARLAWANSLDVAEAWELRLVGLAGREFGDRARDGVVLETRASATRVIGGSLNFGVHSFNDYGATGDVPAVSAQDHSIGPVLAGRAGDFIFQLDALFGLTERAPDANLRFLLQWRL